MSEVNDFAPFDLLERLKKKNESMRVNLLSSPAFWEYMDDHDVALQNLELACNAIVKLQKENAELKDDNHWISVRNMLPEPEVSVLAIVDIGADSLRPYVACMDTALNWWVGDTRIYHPKLWQPLPPMPESEES